MPTDIPKGRQMAKSTIKLLVGVDINHPNTGAVEGKLKGAELAEWLRNQAEAQVVDSLTLAELNPKVLRVRVERKKA
jgi:hypothetical protein